MSKQELAYEWVTAVASAPLFGLLFWPSQKRVAAGFEMQRWISMKMLFASIPSVFASQAMGKPRKR